MTKAPTDDIGIKLTQERINAMTSAGFWPNRTIVDYMDDALADAPDKVCVTDHNSTTGAGTMLTYRQLDRLSRRIAVGLANHGINKGDVVALQLPSWWQFMAIHLACVHIGAITNPLMPIFREREMNFMLSFANTKALVIPQTFRGFDYPAMMESIRTELSDLEHVFVIGGGAENSFEAKFLERRWEDRADAGAIFQQRRADPNDLIEICYTSGTTGEPKGVMHTSNTLLACMGVMGNQGLSDRSVVFMASPLAHQTGFLYGFMLPLVLGGRTVLQDIWEPNTAARIIHDEGVTFTMGSTPFLSDLSHTSALDQFPPKDLELFVCAGAPIPRVLAQSAAARLGARIAAGWGMSENGMVTATLPNDPQNKIFGTDGCAWEGHEVRVIDEGRRQLKPGQTGNLQTRGAANFIGYLKRPEAYAVDKDGWFDTGDIAIVDEDGYIRITSRAKDIIIRGGENVPVVEIEELLYRHGAVQDAAVVAMPDERLGERGCAFVSLMDGKSFTFEDMLFHFEQEQLTKNYWPERLEIIKEFPRTPSGKIQKFKLREIAQNFNAKTD